jgi:hypothetical protein
MLVTFILTMFDLPVFLAHVLGVLRQSYSGK